MGKNSHQTLDEIVRHLKIEEGNGSPDQLRVSFSQLKEAISENAGRNSRTIMRYIRHLKQSGRMEEKELEEVNGYAFVID
jgi:hypothetical protein